MSIYLKKVPAVALSSVAMALLVACGGGGGGSGGSPSASAISGAVIDGYIEGAKVCLDLNANGACDAGEPSATTDSNGKYTLEPGNANTAGLNLIAEIPDTAKDSDDGGQTLAAAGKSAYTMATFADQPAVLTPLTTLIVGKVAAESLTPTMAKERVLASLGLPADTNPHSDHIAEGNLLVQSAAQQVASRLQQAQGALPSDTAPAGRFAALFEALSTQQNSSGAINADFPAGTLMNMPSELSAIATGQLFAYKMPGAKGPDITATAMLFAPQTAAPETGWPLVVFGHGTVGVAQDCAPSVTMEATGAWLYSGLIAQLVDDGYAVVAPDYEGLGPRTMGVVGGHPYLDLGSAGRSMALAAVAAKQLLGTQLSGKWMTLGHSQGGHAALAGAQFAGLAEQQDASLDFLGAIAIAPASNLQTSLNEMWVRIQSSSSSPSAYIGGYEAVGISNLYASYLVQGSQSTLAPVDPALVFGARMRAVHLEKAGTECLGAFSATIQNDVGHYAATAGASPAAYPGVINASINTPAISRILGRNEPGQVRIPGSTLIVQGAADTTVLPSSSQALLNTLMSKGAEARLTLLEQDSATHAGILALPEAIEAIRSHLQGIFDPS